MVYAIMAIALIVSSLLLIETAHATYVNNTINYDTTWTRTNSPYWLTANIVVASGITLTIEPGVTVNFGSFQLQVNGVLNAQGNATDKIVFSSGGGSNQNIDFTSSSTPWTDQSSSGSIISNVILYSVPIVIDGSSPLISNNYFVATALSPIIVNGGGPQIISNTVNLQSYAEIYVNSGNPVISSNTIKGGGQNSGIHIDSGASAYISDNSIINCWTGIYSNGYSTILQNNIMNNINDGIISTNPSTLIQSNAIANNVQAGISSGSVGVAVGSFLNNTIVNNSEGIWGPSSSTTIAYNNIYGNTENMHLTQNGSDVTATNNWWGSADSAAVYRTIWDSKNSSNLGTATFAPFLTQLNPSAPTIPSSIPVPTVPPTPSTTNPSVTPEPSPNVSSTPEPSYPDYTVEPTLGPTPSYDSTASPTPAPGNFSITDVENMAVIVLFIVLAISIIIVLNRKYSSPKSRETSNQVVPPKKKSTQ